MNEEIHSRQTGVRQEANVDNTGAEYHRTRDVYNGPVNHQTITQENSKTYTVPRKDNLLAEVLSRTVLGLLGERNALITGIGALVLGVSLLAAPAVSLPSALAWLIPGPSYGVWFGVVGVLLLAALQYKEDHECEKCDGTYTLTEDRHGQVRDVETREGTRRATKRTYTCQACGYTTTKTKQELIPPE